MPLASLAFYESDDTEVAETADELNEPDDDAEGTPFVPPVSDDVCRVVQLLTRPVDRERNAGLFGINVRLAACRLHMIDMLSGGGERGNALEVWDRVMMHISK